MNNNIRANTYQHNDAIENEPKFDCSFNISRGTEDPLPVVTVILRGVKKHRGINVADVKYLWDIGATNIMIKNKAHQIP